MRDVHEITLAGFDGGSDETDHLVLWIEGDRAHVEAAIAGTSATLHGRAPGDDPMAIDFRIPQDAEALSRRLAEHEAILQPSPGRR